MTEPTIRLFLLGPTELRGLDAAALVRQPKRLALLAYLTLVTADGYRRRDPIVAMFWPELGQAQARAQLRKALHALREQLGVAAVETRGEEEVRVSPVHVWCDALAFAHAVQAGEWSAALALYRGELLEGLFAAGVAQDFEDWIGQQRRTLREQAGRAAMELSRSAEASGDLPSAIASARRGLELTPDDEDGVRWLMRLLDRRGDRAGALRVYADWQVRLRDEYGVDPAPETRRVAHHVQATRDGESHETPPAQSAIAQAEPAGDVQGGRRPAHFRVGRRVLWSAGLLVGIPLALWGASRFRRPAAAHADRATLAVLPVRTIGTRDLELVARGLAEELTTALTQATELSVRAPTCLRDEVSSAVHCVVAAAWYVDGSMQREADRMRVALRLVRSADGATAWAGTFDADARNVLEAEQLIATRAGREIRQQLGAMRSAGAQRR